jgi:hypothetical protein
LKQHLKLNSFQTTKSLSERTGVKFTRNVTIKSPLNGFGDVTGMIGTEYIVALWHAPSVDISTAQVNSSNSDVKSRTDDNSRVTVVNLPVAQAHSEEGVTIQMTYAEAK